MWGENGEDGYRNYGGLILKRIGYEEGNCFNGNRMLGISHAEWMYRV